MQTVPFHYLDFNQGTVLSSLRDDDTYGPFQIGFDFTFFGVNYDTIYIGTNGEITFVAQPKINWSRNFLPDSVGLRTAIYFPKSDFYASTSSKIYQQIIGQQPHRKYVVTFDSMLLFGDALCLQKLNFFQLELHETTGAIRMNVLKKDTCTYWESARLSTFGIQDLSRTIAVSALPYYRQPLRMDSISILIGFEYSNDFIPLANDTFLCAYGDSSIISARIPAQSPAAPWQIVQWRRNAVPIQNSTDSIFVARSPGDYSVELTNGSTNWISSPVTITGSPQFSWYIQGQLQIEPGTTFNYQVDQLSHLDYYWMCNGCTIVGGNQSAMVSVSWPNIVADPFISVIVTDSNCIDTLSRALRFFPLSVQEETEPKIKIYPNPGSGVFIVEADFVDLNTGISVTDLIGRVIPVEFIPLSQDQWQLILKDTTPGIYILTLNSDQGKIVRRLSVQ